jgi:hypothetical protein
MIHGGDAVVRAFAAAGWRWGGNWSGSKDYQHFSQRPLTPPPGGARRGASAHNGRRQREV